MSTIETEIVVIGGGAAGLSAALTLARARRGVIVIDRGEPRNAPALGAHGLPRLGRHQPVRTAAEGTRGSHLIRWSGHHRPSHRCPR